MSKLSNAVVTLVDNGELEDVRRVLADLDIDFRMGFGTGEPGTLLVTTPDYAFQESSRGPGFESDRYSFHIVVVEKRTRELCLELKQGRCDFLVERPTHPAALKMLILYALYSGNETRRLPRVAMGEPVKVQAGLKTKPATLIQLSTRGCGLLYAGPIEEGDKISVVLPSELTGSKALTLPSRVATVRPTSVGEPGELELAVIFRPPDVDARRLIQKTMAAHAVGSAALRPRKGADRRSPRTAAALRTGGSPKGEAQRPPRETHPAAAGAEGVGSAAGSANRRASPRKRYKRPIMASGGGVADTIIGRDLSLGGMRVAPDARLSLGDEFKLMIYGMSKGETVLVEAVVIRDDGEEGCVLQFKKVSKKSLEKLQVLVDRLPALSSEEGRPAGPHTVVSEIVSEEG